MLFFSVRSLPNLTVNSGEPFLLYPLMGTREGDKARNKLIPYRADLRLKSRELRKYGTRSEVLLWQEIKNRQLLGYQFHRQVPMLDYIVDFYCHELWLAIEIDGYSHSLAEVTTNEEIRQSRLEGYGISFLRYDDEDVLQNRFWVLNDILEWIEENR